MTHETSGASLPSRETTGPAVVVGYDGSEHALRAVRWAAAFASARHEVLSVVSTWQVSAFEVGPAGAGLDTTEDQHRLAQENARHAISTVGCPDAQAFCVQGRAREVLAAGSSERVLVLGTAGHLGLLGAVTCGVARWCVRRAGCPVVLLGPWAACAPVERVVVPGVLDPTGSALRWGAATAAATGAALEVVDAGDSAALDRVTCPGDLLVLPNDARTTPRYRSISCPVAVLPRHQR